MMQSLAFSPSNRQHVPTAAWMAALSLTITGGMRTRSTNVAVQEFMYIA